MNWFSFFLLIILFQEGFCCLKIRPTVQCTCPDFRGLVIPGGNPSIIDEGGCDRKMICGKHFYTSVLFKFNETEISRPSDVEVYMDHWLRSTLDLGQNLESGPAIDFFDYFGIICENSTWYATKAPLGFEYTSIEGKWKGSGNGGELEGKKTKVDSFSCHPPGSAQCTCPDIRELVDPRDETTVTSMDIGLVPFTMKDGCVTSITCGTHIWTWIRTYYNESEITPPDDMYEYDASDYVNIDAVATGKWNDPPGYSIDMFSYFGLICENNEWYVTKYPVGIEYFTLDDIKRFGENGELDGKKSKVKKIFCMLPGETTPTTPVTTPANLCDKCDIHSIRANPENGMDLKPNSLTEIGQDGCVLTYLRCTIENTICISMQVYAKTATETVAIGNDDTIVSDATITCQPNGKYGFGTTKDIESVYCVYEGCM
ncbi:hypothetical protein CRE_14683 [Caenorhabditis remanei]|uniref:DUF281 domain-containing protein n=1 Tax=Caenorhabditis remanei TaxID=31234 RepID=E3M9J9_CAERE|nr:hypothetical protein CRE_14683 [Caenorhabditis remanei]